MILFIPTQHIYPDHKQIHYSLYTYSTYLPDPKQIHYSLYSFSTYYLTTHARLYQGKLILKLFMMTVYLIEAKIHEFCGFQI